MAFNDAALSSSITRGGTDPDAGTYRKFSFVIPDPNANPPIRNDNPILLAGSTSALLVNDGEVVTHVRVDTGSFRVVVAADDLKNNFLSTLQGRLDELRQINR